MSFLPPGANLNKIENTPAYLLPKIGTFCYDLLKSMLNNYAESSSKIYLLKIALVTQNNVKTIK